MPSTLNILKSSSISCTQCAANDAMHHQRHTLAWPDCARLDQHHVLCLQALSEQALQLWYDSKVSVARAS